VQIDFQSDPARGVNSLRVSDSGKWLDAVKEAASAHCKGGMEGNYDQAIHCKEREKLIQWFADEIGSAVKDADVIPIKGKRHSHAYTGTESLGRGA
jgi:hypothetical protein